MDFETARQISNQAISEATHKLGQHLVSLKELTLNCRYTERFEEDEVPIIQKEGFPSIEELHLYLPNNSFSFDFSGSYQRLKVLTLAFGQCVDMPGDKIGETLAPLFAFEFKNLRILTIKLGQVQQIGDEDLGTLCSFNWNCFLNLKEFTFGISDSFATTDDGLEYVSKLIDQHLASLVTFKFIFRGLFSYTENGIKNLCLTVANSMKQLKCLEFDFNLTNISQEVIDIVLTQIAENLKKLKRIRIYFVHGEQGDDIDFIFKMKKKLSFVPTVDFYYSSKIEDS